jgi:organic radical activating enzyme
MTTKTVGISEIFSSWQGEGPHLGERHLFIRFERCNVHCEYCDELWKPASEMELASILEEVENYC